MIFLVRLIQSSFERTAFLDSQSVGPRALVLSHHPEVAVDQALVSNIRGIRWDLRLSRLSR